MNKLVVMGFIMFVSGLSSQIALADINASTSETTNPDVTGDIKQKNTSWLGVWIENIPMSLNKHLSSILKEHQGLIIRKVSAGSPAAKAGLKPYDIIAKFNDQQVFSEQQLVNLIRSTKPESKIELGIIRQGKLITQEVITEASPEQNATIKKRSHYLPPFARHQDMRMRPHSPWMNEPFFKHGFNQDFLDQKFNYMQQQMNQLQQQRLKNQQFNQQNSWSQFESIQIESTGKDKHRAKVKYEDSGGNKKKFVFQGNMNEIREQIMAHKEMDEDKKQSLLQALDMNNAPLLPFGQNGFMLPNRFNQPSPMPGWFHN